MGMVSSLNLFCPGVIETYSWTGEQVRFSRSHAQRSQYGPRRRWGVQQLAQTAPVPWQYPTGRESSGRGGASGATRRAIMGRAEIRQRAVKQEGRVNTW